MYLYVGSVGLGETFEVHGWGPTGSADWGDLREDPDGDPLEVSARYDLQLRTQAYQGRARLCNGDSGTPMLKLVTGRKSAVTVFSNHYVDTPESLCTCYKCREEHTRLGPKLAWISARVENPGHDGCKVSSHHADLRWCW
jgi:hypothetical protein